MTKRDEHRDVPLGEAIAHVPVPPREATFMSDLLAAMAAVDETLASDGGDSVDEARIDVRGPAPEELFAAAGGAGYRSRPGRAARWLAAVAAVVAVAAALAVTVYLGRHMVRELQQPPTASAAEVVAQVRRTLATFDTVSATLVTSSAPVIGPTSFEPGWTSADWFARAHVEGSAQPASPPVQIVATADGRLCKISPLGVSSSTTLNPDGSVTTTVHTPKVTLTRDDVPAEAVETYNDKTGVMSFYSPGFSLSDEEGSGWQIEQAILTTGTPLGAPDLQGESASWMNTEGLTISALSLVAHGFVSATTFDGRPALVVAADVTPGPIVPSEVRSGGEMTCYGEYDRVEVTVDKATWFPVRVTTRLHGDIVDDMQLTDIRVNAPSDAHFSPAFPEGVKIDVDREGFRRVSYREAAHAFGYRPLAPRTRDLPEGFGFSAAAVAQKVRFFVMRGMRDAVNKDWIPSREITALQYRAAFLSFTVTTRREQGMHVDDPFVSDPSQVATPGERETVTIKSGALRGVKAQLVMPAAGVPHLWAFYDGLMVTIGGDLARDQLLRVAGSLEPLR